MRKNSTKNDEPSRASLQEMPEVDLHRQRKVSRGRYAARARRSLEVLVVDKKVVAALGGADAIPGILRALAEALAMKKKRRAA